MISSGLVIQGKKLIEYLEAAKQEQKTEEKQISEAKTALLEVIERILLEQLYEN